MMSIMELLIKKKHPEYTHDEIWGEICRFCEKNELKIKLFLKRYRFKSDSETFEELRHQVIALLCDSSDREIQRMLINTTNFEQGMLVLLANEVGRKQVFNNLSNRLKKFIKAEAYTIAHKLDLDDKMFEKVMRKVLAIFFSEEMEQFKREQWEYCHGFHIESDISLERKFLILLIQCPKARVVRWNKSYEQLQIKADTFLFSDFEIDQYRTIVGLLKKGEYRKGLEASYFYSASGKGNTSIMVSGLVLTERKDIVFLSYIVRQQQDEKVIYRMKHDVETFPNINDELIAGSFLEEVDEEDFWGFCKMLYGQQYV